MSAVDVTESRVNVRRNRILDRLDREGRVGVGDLAAELAVTEETVRRDLRALENGQKIRRTHGGAVRLFADESHRHRQHAEWQQMAEAAADRASDARAIFIGAGPVCESLAALLAPRPDIHLVVASTSVALAAVMANGDASVHSIGGSVLPDGSLSGMWAREQLSGMEVDLSVVEADGIAPDGQLLTSDPEFAAVQSAAIVAARAVIVVVKRNSPAGAGHVKFCHLSEIDHVVVGPGLSADEVGRLHLADVDVITTGAEEKR